MGSQPQPQRVRVSRGPWIGAPAPPYQARASTLSTHLLDAFSAVSGSLAPASHPAAGSIPSGVTAATGLAGWTGRKCGSAQGRIPASPNSIVAAGVRAGSGCVTTAFHFKTRRTWDRGLSGAHETEAEADALRPCLLAP